MRKMSIARGMGDVMHYLFVGISLLVNSLYLFAAFSSYISPAQMLWPAFLGLAFPLFLGLQCGVLLLWLIRTKWWWCLANILILAISFGSIRDYIPVNTNRMPKNVKNPSIGVLSYNVMAFGFESHSATKPNPILQYIRSSGADIVCLQEAMVTESKNSVVSRKIIRTFLPEYKYIDIATAQPNRGSTLMLLSKWPILKAERIEYPSDFNGSRAYIVEIDGLPVLVINNHLESFRLTMQDGDKYIDYLREGEAGALKTQMTRKLGPAFILRAAAADAVNRYIKGSPYPHIIVCGDFNDSPISYAHKQIGRGLVDAFRESGNGLGFSYNRGRMHFRIDYILHSKSFRGYDCHVDRSIYTSDHFPISCRLLLSDSVR